VKQNIRTSDARPYDLIAKPEFAEQKSPGRATIHKEVLVLNGSFSA